MLATLSRRRAIWTLQGPTEVLVRFDGATMGGALWRDGQSRRKDATRDLRLNDRIAAVSSAMEASGRVWGDPVQIHELPLLGHWL